MTAATEKAVERIERYRKRDSDAVSLARLASLAVRIEPNLLRRLRLEVLPELDVGTEADVWFGPLVESRGADAMVLDAHVADVLREDLASDRKLLRQVHRVTEDAHREAPPTVRLEEAVNALALLNEGDVAASIDAALRPAIRAIYEGGDRAREIAHWVRRAMPRLHRTVVRTQSALSLLLASDSLLGSRPLTQTPDAEISADALAWILSPDARLQRIPLGMELLQRGVRFVAPRRNSPAIELPKTDPALVELEWTRDQHQVKTLIEVEAGRTVDLETDVSEVIVRTLAGDEYVIERKRTEFASDIFVSYAHLDDVQLVEGRKGWVANVHRALQTRLGQLRGEDIKLWRDPKLQGSDAFDEGLLGALRQSAVFVAVVSPRYLKSEWCRRELEEFLKASEATGGVRIGDKSRLFKLMKMPVPLDQQPSALQQVLGYEFFKVDPDSGRVRESDETFGPEAERDFWLKLDDLAHDIAGVLDQLARLGTSPSPITETNRTIYLAETTADLRDRREAIKSELLERGHTVLPERPLPTSEPECSTFVREQLARCTLSVHLIGRNYGLVPEGSNDSVVVLQHHLAVERGLAGEFGYVIWIPPALQIDDERQRRVVEALQNDPGQLTGGEIVKVPSVNALMDVLRERLEPAQDRPQPIEPSLAKLVYLICDERDVDFVRPLTDALFKAGAEVVLPVFGGDEAEIREAHEEHLRECDGSLIYYGAGNEVWLRRKLRELQKSAGYGRTKRQPATAVYIGPPVRPEKARFRTHEAIVIQGADSQSVSEESLRPFLDLLT